MKITLRLRRLASKTTVGIAASALAVAGVGAVAVAAVNAPSAAERPGALLSWTTNGAGNAEELGHATGVVAEPAAVEGKTVLGAWTAGGYSIAYTEESGWTGWGRAIPVHASVWQNIPAGIGKPKAAAAGTGCAVVVKQDGTVVAWGSSAGVNTPPAGLSGVTKVAVGQKVALALKSDGTVVAWGNTATSTVPAGLSDVVDISASQDTAFAVKSDGTVVSWGSDLNGAASIPESVQGATRQINVRSGGPGGASINAVGAAISWGSGTPSLVASGAAYLTGTSPQYVVTDAGKVIYPVGTTAPTEVADSSFSSVSAAGYLALGIASADEPEPGFEAETPPVITGKPIPGQILELTPAAWTETPDSVTTEWFADGVKQEPPVTTETTLRLGTIHKGKKIVAKQTAVKGDQTVVSESAEFGPIEGLLAALGKPTIAGEAKAGETLTATDPRWSEVPESITHQWFADGAEIEGETGGTLVLTADQVGKKITVKSVATFMTQTVTSAASVETAAVEAGPEPELEATSPPVISGKPIPGQTLQLAPAQWSLAPDSVTTEWFAGGVKQEPPTATDSTLRLGTVHAGKTIVAKQTAVRGDKTVASESVEFGPVEPLLAALGKPTIAGDAKAGQTLTVTDPRWSQTPESVTYQWYADTVEISGANGATLLLAAEQVGKKITVKAIATFMTQTATSTASAETAAVEAGPIGVVTAPVVSGTAKVGETLTGTPAVFDDDSAVVTNRWYAGDNVIDGATGTELELGEAQLGKKISFESTATRGSETVSSKSEQTTEVQAADIPLSVKTPAKATGTALVGEKLTGTPAEFEGDVDEVTNQWLAAGEPISGATGNELTLTPSMAGKSITFRSTAARGDSTLDSVSDPVGPVLVKLTVDKKAMIAGTARVGETLTGIPASFTDPAAAVTNRWLADGREIDGATGSTLKLTAALVGKKIAFESTAKRGSDKVTSTSDATAEVKNVALTVTKRPSISGTAQIGKTLTATPATFSDDSATVTNQWYADDKLLAGATGTTLEITKAMLGTRIRFSSSAVRGEDAAVSMSDPSGQVIPTELDKDAEGKIAAPDSATAGETITIEVGKDLAGDKVQVWLFSTPRLISVATIAADGTITVKLPTDIAAGDHRIAIYSAAGDLIGWQAISIVNAGGGPGSSSGPGATPGSGSGLSLPDTGTEIAMWMAPLALLLIGVGALVVRPRRRRH